MPDRTDRLFVVNRHDKYLGGLDITRLLTDDPEKTVGEVMDSAIEGIAPETPAREVAKLFEDRDLVSAPVVSDGGCLAALRSTTSSTSSAKKRTTPS